MFIYIIWEMRTSFLINRMPSSSLKNRIPHSTIFPNDPLFHVSPKVFGCTSFVHNISPSSDKLSTKAIKFVFIGYSCLQKDTNVILKLLDDNICQLATFTYILTQNRKSSSHSSRSLYKKSSLPLFEKSLMI